MKPFSIMTRDLGSARIVDVSGELDLHNSPALRAKLFDSLQRSALVAANLSEVQHIDSSGVAVLLEALREAQRDQREFVLYGLNSAVQDVFRLTHVNRVFRVADSEEEAIGSLRD